MSTNSSSKRRNRGRVGGSGQYPPQQSSQQFIPPPLSFVEAINSSSKRTTTSSPTLSHSNSRQHKIHQSYSKSSFAPATTTSNKRTTTNKKASLLVVLSESCHKHAVSAHSSCTNHNNNNNNISTTTTTTTTTTRKVENNSLEENGGNTDLMNGTENVPIHCSNAIQSLRTILPKIEQSYSPNPSTTTTTTTTLSKTTTSTTTTIHDVKHICDFYRDVLSNGFCPFAYQLFLTTTEQPTTSPMVAELLPRVHYLLQHLTSTTVTLSSLKEQLYASTNDIHCLDFVRHVAHTAAQLLHTVPDSNSLNLLIWDLIHLLKDLSIASESNLLQQQQQQTTSTTTTLCDDNEILMEVSLFHGMMQKYNNDCNTTTTNTTTTTANNHPPNGTEFILQIPNELALLSLQCTVWMILEHVMNIRKERRLQLSNPHLNSIDVILEEMDESFLTVCDHDLYFGILQSDHELTQAMLLALRQTLLTKTTATTTTTTTTTGNTLVSEQSNDKRKYTLPMAFLHWSKQTSLKILLQLHSDWDRTGVPTLSLLQETSYLVVEAALTFLRSPKNAMTSMDTMHTWTNDIARLIHGYVFIPPPVQCAMTPIHVATAIQQITISTLLESIPSIHVRIKSVPLPSSPIGFRTNETNARSLDSIILRTIYITLLNHQQRMDIFMVDILLTKVLLSRTILQCLFDFLSDPILADTSIWILSFLWHIPSQLLYPATRLMEMDVAAMSCYHPTTLPMLFDPIQGLIPSTTLPDALHNNSISTNTKRKTDWDINSPNDPRMTFIPSSTSSSKRQKYSMDDQEIMHPFFDDMLTTLFQKAMRSVRLIQDSLKDERRDEMWWNSKGCYLLHDEILVVCSTIKFIVTVLESKSNTISFQPTYPYLHQYTTSLLETVLLVGTFLLSIYHPNQDPLNENDRTDCIVEIILSCGAFLHLIPMHSNGINLFKLHTWDEFIACTKTLFKSRLDVPNTVILFSNNINSGPLKETLIGCAMKGEDCRTWDRNILSVFDTTFAVTIGDSNNVTGCVSVVGRLLSPVDPVDEDMNQCIRLELVVKRMGKIWHRPNDLFQFTLNTIAPLLIDGAAIADATIRLLVWQSILWILLRHPPLRLRTLLLHTHTSTINELGPEPGMILVTFLLDVAFADPDATIRDYTSREIGKCFMTGSAIVAAMANNDEWKNLHDDSDFSSLLSRQFAASVKNRLFYYIDNVLLKHCSVPQSQLSSAVSSKQLTSPRHVSNESSTVLSFRRSASRTLCSLCQAIPSRSYFERLVFEHAMIRVVRMWAGIETIPRWEGSSVCFAELSRVFVLHGQLVAVHKCMQASLSPALFRDILIPGSSFVIGATQDEIEHTSSTFRERQFNLLSTFLRFSANQSWSLTSDLVSSTDEFDIERCLESCLPYAISQLIVEKDYDALRLTTAYKLYLLYMKRLDHKRRRRNKTSNKCITSPAGIVVGEVLNTLSKSASRHWACNLDDQTRQLCLAPGLIEQIIPLVFIRAGRSELIFFTNNVLQNKLSLKQLVMSREQLSLKNFVLELGRNPEITKAVVRGMETAAVARSNATDTSLDVLNPSQMPASGESAVTAWVSTHFMYLLVNVVQFKWSTKTNALRSQALQSLLSILDFLRATEASQYLPQIMATVNAALSVNFNEDECDRDKIAFTLKIRLLAIQVLSKFIKLIPEKQKNMIGQNLTSIVVSVIPILSDDERNQTNYNSSNIEESRNVAVDLLEYLTANQLGKFLAPYFSEIPFLPPSSLLDPMRAHLTALGVTFDNLKVMPTQGGHHTDTSSRSVMSDNGSADSVGASTIMALKRRLETVSLLLDNDNASVRCVVLRHLTALLHANRNLFHDLIESETITSMKDFLTEVYSNRGGISSGVITTTTYALLQRCIHENDSECRVLLATCIGEVGAIGADRLEKPQILSRTGNTIRDRSSAPPWYSTSHGYGLKLVTSHLVIALKAAPTSSDQHKVAFSIQQLLSFLNEGAKDGLLPISTAKNNLSTPVRSYRSKLFNEGISDISCASKPQMEHNLLDHLIGEEVIDILEPFWFSEFHEAETNPPREPPFFRNSLTFYGWLSNWCRFMVHRTHAMRRNEWTELFFACRTALRTQAGITVAEMLLPLLILDHLCFGEVSDHNTLMSEINDVLLIDLNGKSQSMSLADHRRAVNIIFGVVDLFGHWAEPESEQRYGSKSGRQSDACLVPVTDSCVWDQHEAVMRINDLVSKIPYSLRAKAAESVEMYACALQMLEVESRSSIADQVFGRNGMDLHRDRSRSRAAGICTGENLGLMKDVLAYLDDYETMASIGDDDILVSPSERVRDSIRQKLALRDWQSALHDYERAQQLEFDDASLRVGALRCLLELGHFESVILQVDGIIRKADEQKAATSVPLAIEASWRLGKWEKLSDLLVTQKSVVSNSEGLYQVYVGEAMLNIHERNIEEATLSIEKARKSVMDGLSSVARESYSRSYDHIVRLHALREIEDTANLRCQLNSTTFSDIVEGAGIGWGRRLNFVSAFGATPIINVRLALARLSNEPECELSLFLRMGRSERKRGMLSVAANSFAKAEAVWNSIERQSKAMLKSDLQIQLAKLKHDSGETSIALRMLSQENFESMAVLDDNELIDRCCHRVSDVLGIEDHGMGRDQMLKAFVRSALKSTQWMIEGGLKGKTEITLRYETIHRVVPTYEKGHFHYAKYVESLLQSRILALQGRYQNHGIAVIDETQRNYVISRDETCQRLITLAIKHYTISLQLDIKHVYQSLPRLLSLWFDFSSVKLDVSLPQAEEKKISVKLFETQSELNAFLAESVTNIPAKALYTAMPQLISRIVHENSDTAQVARAMLRRILTKYPAQAMWPLAWVRQSQDPERKKIGADIFKDAIKAFSCRGHEKMRNLLASSKTLMDYLFDLARAEVKDKNSTRMKFRPITSEIDLTDFVFPIQAALSISLTCGDSGRVRELFPRHVPRVRAFDLLVNVMSSKARPKKLTAFVVSADSKTLMRVRSNRSTERIEDDIGELHFLVKQEIKGDLRKDARVQDLNNVVNRIMASPNSSKCLVTLRRRLHLRTFTVTCLSEETGILEWVPHTNSLRSLISATYNPQAKPSEGKRRGKRIMRFSEPPLKLKFEKCQEMYFGEGNLTKAALYFEKDCLKPFPPLLYWWFISQYPDPHSWYEARTSFTLSAAVWSAVGHVIGLGDRHSDNILLDKNSGDLVHVDFDCIFDKALNLPKPEVVPFRLTQNMVDAFGPSGADGVYSSNLKKAMRILRDNRDTLLSVLEPFTNDPIINKSKHRGKLKSSDKDPTSDAKQKICIIEERLKGIYNLRNPNLKRYKRIDTCDTQQDDDMSHKIPLPVEGQVHKMIAEATSSENLVQLYIGWMPWA